ncbi:hypothetical protein MRX96_028521 [Rhipicephalus microplus]
MHSLARLDWYLPPPRRRHCSSNPGDRSSTISGRATARYSVPHAVSSREVAAVPPALALGVYNAIASARVIYMAAMASLSACQLAALDANYLNAVREYYKLAHTSQVGPTLAEAGETPISLRVTERTLNIVLRLTTTTQGQILVNRHTLYFCIHGAAGE